MFWGACTHCFLNQYCHSFLNNTKKNIDQSDVVHISGETLDYSEENKKYIALRWELFTSEVYEKYGDHAVQFKNHISSLKLSGSQEIVNIPLCLRQENNTGKYEFYPDVRKWENTIEEYTEKYISNMYRKKSTRCKQCKYNTTCEGIHINFIRSYGFKILEPIQG